MSFAGRGAPARPLALFLGVLGACAGCAGPRIDLREGTPPDGRAAFEVRGLDRAFLEGPEAASIDWSRAFTVRVEPSSPLPAGSSLPPILGSTRLEGDVLRFEPRFPLEPGLRYRAALLPGAWTGRPEGGPPAAERVFALPPRVLEPRTVVERVHPTADVLPENQLKLYLHFSAPMRRGEAYSRIRLLDGAGREVDTPFLELGEELWDPSGTRFTLFFDPARVKRLLRPHEELGSILEEGKRYALVVDAAWTDAEGAPLKAPFRKDFLAGPADYKTPEPSGWSIAPPAAGTRNPLVVAFGEPLDHALIRRLIRVQGPGGEEIAGTVEVGKEERDWRFTPEAPWSAGTHKLLVDAALEDLAGNSIGRPFEVDMSRNLTGRIQPRTVSVAFEVAALSGPR